MARQSRCQADQSRNADSLCPYLLDLEDNSVAIFHQLAACEAHSTPRWHTCSKVLPQVPCVHLSLLRLDSPIHRSQIRVRAIGDLREVPPGSACWAKTRLILSTAYIRLHCSYNTDSIHGVEDPAGALCRRWQGAQHSGADPNKPSIKGQVPGSPLGKVHK